MANVGSFASAQGKPEIVSKRLKRLGAEAAPRPGGGYMDRWILAARISAENTNAYRN
jgi:hypothetical protein